MIMLEYCLLIYVCIAVIGLCVGFLILLDRIIFNQSGLIVSSGTQHLNKLSTMVDYLKGNSQYLRSLLAKRAMGTYVLKTLISR